jgi:hypothetical protein
LGLAVVPAAGFGFGFEGFRGTDADHDDHDEENEQDEWYRDFSVQREFSYTPVAKCVITPRSRADRG